ncbi:MAG: hypothetical protein AAF696_39275, partial [Bacteroidota bacterium]
MRNKAYIKWFLFGSQFFILLCALFYFPFLQKHFPSLRTSALAGVSPDLIPYELNVQNWLDEKFQDYYQQKVLDNRELRPFLIPKRNQLFFDLFKKSANAKMQIGKDNYLFDKNGIKSYVGIDFQGEEFIQERFRKLAFIKKHLEAQGTQLLVFIPPTKSSIFPEKLPTPFDTYTVSRNNRIAILQELDALGIEQINFFPLVKNQFPDENLYPKGGLHWSHTASALAADTLRKRIETLLDKKLPAFRIEGFERTLELRPPDEDLALTLNLSRGFPKDSMSYPIINFVRDSLDYAPKIAVIGDSYYRMMYDMGFHKHTFSPHSLYWHYFSTDISPEFPL